MNQLFSVNLESPYLIAFALILCLGIFIKSMAYFIRLKRAEDLQKVLRKNGGIKRSRKATKKPVLEAGGRKIISDEGNRSNCISTARKRLEIKTGKTFNLRLYRFDSNKCEYVLR